MVLKNFHTFTSINRANLITYFYPPNEFHFSIRRNEADAMFRFKFTELDTLVELAVINHNGRLASPEKKLGYEVFFLFQNFPQHYTGQLISIDLKLFDLLVK